VLTYNGSTWSAPHLVDHDLYLKSISCVASGFCAAVDEGGNALTYEHGAWSSPVAIDSGKAPFSVSCASSTFCMAVDSDGNALKFNGTSWSSATPLDPSWLIQSVSCPTSHFCVAVDQDSKVFTYNGTRWSAGSVIETGGNYAIAVSCVSASYCLAVDTGGNSLTYNGRSWSTPQPYDTPNEPWAVSCPSENFCAAVDYSGNASVDDAGRWTNTFLGGGPMVSVSCAAVDSCVAISKAGYAFTEGLPATTTSLTFSTSSASYGDEGAEALRVAVSAGSGTPSGFVGVRAGAAPVCTIALAAGRGSCRLSATGLTAGEDALTASYSGSTQFAGSSVTETLRIARASTKVDLTLSKTRVAYGHEQAEKLRVTVTPAHAGRPTGRVVVKAGHVRICTITLVAGKGSCTLSATKLNVGTHSLLAGYQQSRDFDASASARHTLKVVT